MAGKSKYYCNPCNMEFSNIREYIEHLKYHEENPMGDLENKQSLNKKKGFLQKMISFIKGDKKTDSTKSDKPQNSSPIPENKEKEIEREEQMDEEYRKKVDNLEHQVKNVNDSINKLIDLVSQTPLQHPTTKEEETPTVEEEQTQNKEEPASNDDTKQETAKTESTKKVEHEGTSKDDVPPTDTKESSESSVERVSFPKVGGRVVVTLEVEESCVSKVVKKFMEAVGEDSTVSLRDAVWVKEES